MKSLKIVLPHKVTFFSQIGCAGLTSEEKKLYEFNARMQITLWSPPTDRVLHDYAWKQWSGL
jgi:hypothetical protein